MAYTNKKSRVSAARAAIDGAMARRAGKPVSECPYDPSGPPIQAFLARWWVKGWNRGRRAGLGSFG